MNGNGHNRWRKAGGVALLTVASLAAGATAPAQNAFRSARAFAAYYRLLGDSMASNTSPRVVLSLLLAVADPANAPVSNPCRAAQAASTR